MHHQVEHHVDVGAARSPGSQSLGPHVAGPEALGQSRQRRVVALDVVHAEPVEALQPVDLFHGGGHRLLDQQGHAALGQGQGHRDVLGGGHGDHGEVDPVRDRLELWHPGAQVARVHDTDQLDVGSRPELAGVERAHVAAPDHHAAHAQSDAGLGRAALQMPRELPARKSSSSTTSGTSPSLSRTRSMAMRSGVPLLKSSR